VNESDNEIDPIWWDQISRRNPGCGPTIGSIVLESGKQQHCRIQKLSIANSSIEFVDKFPIDIFCIRQSGKHSILLVRCTQLCSRKFIRGYKFHILKSWTTKGFQSWFYGISTKRISPSEFRQCRNCSGISKHVEILL
jgi:hypothetical protein